MSIVALSKVTLYGPAAEKEAVLEGLQDLGCLHLNNLRPDTGEAADPESSYPDARQALQYLRDSPVSRRAPRHIENFDVEAVVKEALDVRDRSRALAEEREQLRKWIADLGPWGDFELPEWAKESPLRFWFYMVPHHQMRGLEAISLPWSVVGRDHRFAYVVVIAADQPAGIPVPPVPLEPRSISKMRGRLEQVERELEALDYRRIGLTYDRDMIRATLDEADDRAARHRAVVGAIDQDQVFAVQGWTPSARLSTLRRFAADHQLALTIESPGPFGAGKTVLQGLIARYSTADVVIQVACGERAGEVLETLEDFATMEDPRGGLLMDRTVVICNTSSMPVAAREASIYMGITLGEYYRQMGLNVLLIADSTSRWAQAMRETSGRLEEIPGEEGFPVYLDSAIKGAYERAGVLQTNDGAVGSLTMVGTVSPAGGNFDEPVTQSTLGTVKTFLGLSSARAYKRFYPAVDPLISWSRYLDQLRPYFDEHLQPGWTDAVHTLSQLLHQGETIAQMMQVTGEEGITLNDYVTYQKSLLLDMVYLQQDAYDKVDVSVPLDRQKECLALVRGLIQRDYPFTDKEEAHRFFTQLTGLLKNLNYTPRDAKDYTGYLAQIDDLVKTSGRAPAATPGGVGGTGPS